jgi:hypothetical protein
MKRTVFLSVLSFSLGLPAICSAAVPVTPVPEPGTGLLVVLAGAGFIIYKKFRAPRP